MTHPLRRAGDGDKPAKQTRYRDPYSNKKSKVLVLIGVALALAVGGGVYYTLSQTQSATAAALTPVVVTTRDIPARTLLADSDVTVREVPLDASNAGAYSNSADVVGRVTAVDINTGQLVGASLLVSTTPGAALSILPSGVTPVAGGPDWRAVSLIVPDERAVAGSVTAGQIIDVWVTIPVTVSDALAAKGQVYTDNSTQLIYQNVTVLAKNGVMYVLRLPDKMAGEISHMVAAGNVLFSIVLRDPSDTLTVDTNGTGVTTTIIV